VTAAALDDRALLDACDEGAAAERLAAAVDPAARSLARRDAALLALHRVRYGACLVGITACPGCGERVEAELAVDALLPADPADAGLRVRARGREIEFRMPSAADVRAAADERALAERCVTSPLGGTRLGTDEVAALAERMEAAHPAGDIRLALVCPTCRHEWGERLDLAAFVAARVRADAERVLDEVHALATGYGWTEAEILALPRARRRRYLERLAR
jgi:hypothetical protein